jgi:alpha-N-arabinofuranosidase
MAFDSAMTGTEAGISLFQKDNNYLNMTLIRNDTGYDLVLKLAYPGKEVTELARQPLNNYTGEIIFRVTSDNSRYTYDYSLDHGGSWKTLTSSAADLILSQKYTGANLGLYASANGQRSTDVARFDWIKYQHSID